MGELMAGKGKKIAAALAAVNFYLQQEEAAAAEQQIPAKEPQGIEFSAWGQSGNQEVMSMRKLIQMRAFTRF
ncbi:MAG: hypothetical protein ACN4GW_02620 [Desulforhopalus sp.]